jgi:hypothetical protein
MMAARIVLDVKLYTRAIFVISYTHPSHSSMGKDLLRPVNFIFIPDSIGIQSGVDLFQKFKPYNPVVGSSVKCKAVSSGIRVLRVYIIDSGRIEDLIDTS